MKFIFLQELSHVGSTSTNAEDTSRSSAGSGQPNAPFSFGTRDEDMAMLIQARRTPGGRYRLEQALLSRIAPEVMAENNQYRPVFSSIELYQLFGLAPSHPYQPDSNNQRNWTTDMIPQTIYNWKLIGTKNCDIIKSKTSKKSKTVNMNWLQTAMPI